MVVQEDTDKTNKNNTKNRFNFLIRIRQKRKPKSTGGQSSTSATFCIVTNSQDSYSSPTLWEWFLAGKCPRFCLALADWLGWQPGLLSLGQALQRPILIKLLQSTGKRPANGGPIRHLKKTNSPLFQTALGQANESTISSWPDWIRNSSPPHPRPPPSIREDH